jgi:CheY-like chemotaxis protein
MRAHPVLRVLVVDGDMDSAHALATVLHAMDHVVQFALKAKVALEIARRFRPDIVVLEAPRALADGAELLQALRADDALGCPRLWSIGVPDDPEARRQARASGCEQHLVKPVDCEAVARLVHRAAERRGS